MNKNTVGYIIIIVLLAVTSVFSINLFFKEKTAHDKLNIAKFPYQIGEWRGRDLEITEREYKILETRNLISREYTNSADDRIHVFIVYSETNRSVFHPPEVCLIGSGVTITDKQAEEATGDKYAFLTNKLHLEKEGRKELALYCYKAGKLYTNNYYLQQAYLALHQIFGKRVPGATIRVSMPVRGEEKATLAVLKGFLSETARIVDELN